MSKTTYQDWTLIEWDGNPALKLKCWRKSFSGGHVSVGVGDFLMVGFSYGANSDSSMSGTRWNYDSPPITEKEMMEWVDKCRGEHKTHPEHIESRNKKVDKAPETE